MWVCITYCHDDDVQYYDAGFNAQCNHSDSHNYMVNGVAAWGIDCLGFEILCKAQNKINIKSDRRMTLEFTGEFGGYLAVAFGAGCASGYGFAVKNIASNLKDRVNELKIEIDKIRHDCDAREAELKSQIKEMQDVIHALNDSRLNIAMGTQDRRLSDHIGKAADDV